MLSSIFGSKKEEYIVIKLNGKLRPMHRHQLYEDPLQDYLVRNGIGSIEGGGTFQSQTGEVESCDIEVLLSQPSKKAIPSIQAARKRLGLPKGSLLKIESTEQEIPIGNKEGLALYINGSELSPDTYQNCDINVVIETIDSGFKGTGRYESFWEGPSETALYFYGNSFLEMKESMKDFLSEYPLCHKCRITQSA